MVSTTGQEIRLKQYPKGTPTKDIFELAKVDVPNQVDLIEEYSKKGIVTKEQMIPIIDTINRFIEGYLNYLSLEYDLVLSRMRLHHKMLHDE